MKKSISLAFFLLVPAFLHSSWRVISDNGRETILEVTVEEPQLFLDRPGLSLGRLVSIPQSGGVILSILEEEKSDIPIEEFQERKGLPSKPAEVGRPGILRDFRVVNVRIHPLFEEGGRARLLSRIVLRLEYQGDGPNILNSIPKNSRDFQELYRAFILNYREPERESGPAIFSSEGAKMIIVTPDLYYDEVLPLAQWKTQKGIKTYVAKLSETGSQPSQIKFFLQNAYLNWDPAPEYVLLVGDANDIPVPGSPPSDNYYATLEGDDIFNDVYIGRFPASNAQEAAVMVSKTVNYERNPLMEDPLWFKKGTGIVRDDYDESDSIYYHDILHMADLMVQQGYIHVDTFTRAGGDDYYDVLEAINEGRSIAAYRGQGVGNWWTPFNIPIQSTNNGWKLPVIISTTCATINIDEPGNPYAGETWLKVGTAETPKGAVGFYGTVTVRSHVAEIRSAVFNGFVDFLFPVYTAGSNVITLGAAAEAGRLNLWNIYEDITDYKGFHALGDPELGIWTDTPKYLIVSHPEMIAIGTSTIDITVIDQYSSSPIEGAYVCFQLDTLVYGTGYTDNQGNLTLTLDIPEETVGDTAMLTVTGRNCHPYEATIFVSESGPFVSYRDLSFEDETGGNGDGALNPGEEIMLSLTYKNYGNDTAYSVRGRLRSDNQKVTVTDSSDFLGTLAPGDTVRKENAYSVYLTPELRNGEAVSLQLVLFDVLGDTWESPLEMGSVVGVEVSLVSFQVEDTIEGNGDGEFDPGETASLSITLTNVGGMATSSLEMNLSQKKIWAPFSITDFSSYIPLLDIQDTLTNSDDPFVLQAKLSAPEGIFIPMKITIQGLAETYTYNDTLELSLLLGNPKRAPSGPESYGYFAYDNTDQTSGRAPEFEWLEIGPPGPGTIISEITNEDADTVTLPLPFAFKYYGVSYDSIGICSNGFVEMGSSTYRFGDNTQIPSPGGPKRLISPFWDDLDPSNQGDIYRYYDQANHRFIVEFKDCVHYGGGNPETFQVILFDPLYYPTPTGDGEILFLYKTVSNPSNCTVGIEDHTETQGLQYLFNGDYEEHAEDLFSGRAILFSTNPPVNFNPIRVGIGDLAIYDTSGTERKGILERGKVSLLMVKVVNSQDEEIPNVKGYLSSSSPLIEIRRGIVTFGDILGRKTRHNRENPFLLTVLPSLTDSIARLTLTIRSGENELLRFDFVLPVGGNVRTAEENAPGPVRFIQTGSNPFSGPIKWILSLTRSTQVDLSIYNSAGRRIRSLFRGELPKGSHEFRWEGLDERGNQVSNGVYFVELKTPREKKIERLLILR